MKQGGRPQRVAALLRQEIADLLTRGVKDPRIGFVSIMDVRMSPDLRYANVYVSLFGDEGERKSCLIGLRQSAGWIRREIGKRIRLRYTPEIRFFPDSTLDNAFHLEDVFREIHAQDQADEGAPSPGEAQREGEEEMHDATSEEDHEEQPGED